MENSAFYSLSLFNGFKVLFKIKFSYATIAFVYETGTRDLIKCKVS